jgi:hypothetical protein
MRVPSASIFILLAMLASSHPAFGQTCADRYRLVFADGVHGCLETFPFVDEPIAGWSTGVRKLVPSTGLYSIAATPRIEACPMVVAMKFSKFGPSAARDSQNATTQSRSAVALHDCQEKVGAASSVGSGCTCAVLVEDGRSPMTAAQFNAFVSPR